MSKKFRFTLCFHKQYVQRAQALLKSASKHLYHINISLQRQLSWKESLLLTCQILGLLVNILAADDKHPVLKRNNLTIPIQTELSQKRKTFSQIFAAFLKARLNFKYFQENMTPIDFVLQILRTLKT